MLTLFCPNTYSPERTYICQVIFQEFLGLEYRIENWDSAWWGIQSDNGDSAILLPDILFQTPSEKWLTPESLPTQPLSVWDTRNAGIDCPLVHSYIPVIYGNLNFPDKFKNVDKSMALPVDIFGSAFFMLTRYEEVVKTDRDQYDRFPATASLAYQEGFLERPIINEYIELLWSCMKQVWPQLERKKRIARTLISCDVDQPYLVSIKNLKKQIRQTGGDLLKRKNVKQAARGIINYFKTKNGDFSFDANYTMFDWMMDVNEAAGNKVAFYFKPERTDPKKDADYTLNEPVIQKLMRRIHQRGHEIGLHTSYNTYLNPQQTLREADMLRQAMKKLGIKQDRLGGRQHYLRWKTPETACNWDGAEMDYDSTLSFAGHVGFRCGVCYEYPMYDLIGRKQLAVRQRPLIVMEGSVFGKNYMGLGYDKQTKIRLNELKYRCKKFNGDFTLLWHNSHFINEQDKQIYQEIIA